MKSTKAIKTAKVTQIAGKCGFGDWIMLMQLSKHYDPIVFHDLIANLAYCLNRKFFLKSNPKNIFDTDVI